MDPKSLKAEISEEVAAILDPGFGIDVVETDTVPHSSDGAITFPNLDEGRQGAKLIDTCVLYIDIRRSTELNFTHRPKTVAKLYSAFVRSMTRCARACGGHVRGIIGDRVMVIFDRRDCFANAVDCAILMNSVAQHVIDRHFKRSEVLCGIGIDAGRMLATKTGLRRRGAEQSSYRNLVWLGRPANVASKLTDLANKPGESFPFVKVEAAHSLPSLMALGMPPGALTRKEVYPGDFVRQLSSDPSTGGLMHADPSFRGMRTVERTFVRTPKTPPILMTAVVWEGYRAARPASNVVTESFFRPMRLSVPSYDGEVFAGDVIYTAFKA